MNHPSTGIHHNLHSPSPYSQSVPGHVTYFGQWGISKDNVIKSLKVNGTLGLIILKCCYETQPNSLRVVDAANSHHELLDMGMKPLRLCILSGAAR